MEGPDSDGGGVVVAVVGVVGVDPVGAETVSLFEPTVVVVTGGGGDPESTGPGVTSFMTGAAPAAGSAAVGVVTGGGGDTELTGACMTSFTATGGAAAATRFAGSGSVVESGLSVVESGAAAAGSAGAAGVAAAGGAACGVAAAAGRSTGLPTVVTITGVVFVAGAAEWLCVCVAGGRCETRL